MSRPKVFIILLNWNNWYETKECLDSLARVDYPYFEVLVVDNNSSNEEKIQLKSYELRVTSYELRVLWNAENLGFAGGNNVGIKYALECGADYVMLLNNDTVVAQDFLSELVKAAGRDKSYGIIGSRIYQHAGGLNGPDVRRGRSEVVFDGGQVNFWLTKAEHKTSATDYITGAAMLIKREVIERVGLMRKEYFLYYEDVDWCIRARRAGYRCILVPTSKVWHKVSATNKEGSPSYIYYHTRNCLMLARFNGNILQKIAAYLIGLWILFKQSIKFFLLPSRRVWVRAMTKGIVDFYRGKYGKY